jgi:hypothetical protein
MAHIQLYKTTTDADLKLGMKVMFFDLNGNITRPGVVTKIENDVNNNTILLYYVAGEGKSGGIFHASELKLISEDKPTNDFIKFDVIEFEHGMHFCNMFTKHGVFKILITEVDYRQLVEAKFFIRENDEEDSEGVYNTTHEYHLRYPAIEA